MATVLDRLWSAEQLFADLLKMDSASLEAALGEGFSTGSAAQRPQHAANLAPELWAKALLGWLESAAPLIQDKIDADPLPTVTVVGIRDVQVSLFTTDPDSSPPPNYPTTV